MFRPWRDTRFSADKAPLKTHVAAVFPHRALGRMRGAGLYFEVTPQHVWIGGGLYAPDGPALHAVRDAYRRAPPAAAAGCWRRRRSSATSARCTATQAGARAARIRRRPSRRRPAPPQAVPGLARGAGGVRRAARLLPALLATFAAMVPFVRFLNEPLIAAAADADRDPLVVERGRGRFERTER